ncbi:MAG: flagellar biosynthesis protein FlgN [Treponema sp.]|jgi:ElaB/YqjD/DUF883 family membrane-anchored ribosome-binding protein|nr:flagellar biosynthesis protein FlgN [Treponema sp.]
MAELTDEELNERVAILRRFRTLLEQQRSKFQEYLNVLEKQENAISTEDTNAIINHAELEQQVVAGIKNLQKVIVPMSEMYKSSAKNANSESDKSVESIQNELEKLQDKVLEQNQKNRELLKKHLVQIRSQIENFKNPYRKNRSVYASAQNAHGSLIAVEV